MIDPVTTMFPRERSRWGSAARMTFATPISVTSIVRSKSSGATSAKLPKTIPAWLETSTSSPPSRSTASSRAASSAGRSETSAVTTCAWPP